MQTSQSGSDEAASNAGDGLAARVRMAASLWDLSPRQTEVLARVLQGGSNKDAAAALGCAEVTVEKHLTAIFRAADLRGRSQLRDTVRALEPLVLRSRAQTRVQSDETSREETRRCG